MNTFAYFTKYIFIFTKIGHLFYLYYFNNKKNGDSQNEDFNIRTAYVHIQNDLRSEISQGIISDSKITLEKLNVIVIKYLEKIFYYLQNPLDFVVNIDNLYLFESEIHLSDINIKIPLTYVTIYIIIMLNYFKEIKLVNSLDDLKMDHIRNYIHKINNINDLFSNIKINTILQQVLDDHLPHSKLYSDDDSMITNPKTTIIELFKLILNKRNESEDIKTGVLELINQERKQKGGNTNQHKEDIKHLRKLLKNKKLTDKQKQQYLKKIESIKVKIEKQNNKDKINKCKEHIINLRKTLKNKNITESQKQQCHHKISNYKLKIKKLVLIKK
tara:strand:- start:4026 stop:5012 length:987 start_codon:yes stop_codon:yes gene_type:complete